MSENFRKLRRLARKIDSDIEHLDKTWASPHLLIGGYGNNVEESEPDVERFFIDIKEFREEIIADQEARTKFISITQDDINKVTNFTEQMKQDCESVETLLSDWGHKLLLDTECSPTDESDAESSILTPEQMNHTPSPQANYDQRNRIDVFLTPTINGNQPKGIATPVIKTLASEINSSQRNKVNIASALNRPSKDFLSPYYGRIMK